MRCAAGGAALAGVVVWRQQVPAYREGGVASAGLPPQHRDLWRFTEARFAEAAEVGWMGAGEMLSQVVSGAGKIC